MNRVLRLLRALSPLLLLTGLGPAHADAKTPPAQDCPPTAQAPSADQVEKARAAAKDRGALWRLRKEGRTSYLYGTVHVGKLEWAFPGPQLQKALAETEVLALEIDISAPGFLTEFQQAQQRAAPLALSEGEQQRLDAQADAACLPRGALAALHPAMQAITYASLAGRRDGLDPAYAQEAMLLGAARSLNRPVVSLESVGSQLAVLLPSDPLRVRWLLRQTLDALERQETRGALRTMGQAWEKGDLATLGDAAKLCQCTPSAEEQEFQRRLNDERNGPIAERIAQEHAKGKPLLAAVGTLHMTGPKALPKLLEGLGFQVERVKY